MLNRIVQSVSNWQELLKGACKSYHSEKQLSIYNLPFFVKNTPFAIGCLLILLSACSPANRDIRDFYFPLKSLTEGLVYEYRAIENDSLTPAYWYYRSFIGKDGVFLTGNYYEYTFTPQQFIREELVQNGMLLEDIFLYETDSIGRQQQVAGEILAGNTFPFEIPDTNTIYLYKVSFQFPSNPDQQITLIKNRTFAGDANYEYKGKTYDCIRFDVRELVEVSDTKQGGIEPELSGYELYAEGLGLIYYEKELGAGNRIAYVLYDQYPMEVLEEKFRARQE